MVCLQGELGQTCRSGAWCLAFAFGAKLPVLTTLVTTGLVGLIGYGVSLTLFVLALRHIGTARTVAYLSIAPSVGVAISMVFLHEEPRVSSEEAKL